MLTPFSHPFRFFVFYELFTSLPCIDCYIQFHFLTRSIMTSSSFSNSFNSPFFIFLCTLWYTFWFLSHFIIPWSHPFILFFNYELFTFLPYVDCYIQFPFLTCSTMTSSSFSNSFITFLFSFFSLLICWYMFCYFVFLVTCWYMFCYFVFFLACWYIFCYFIFLVICSYIFCYCYVLV